MALHRVAVAFSGGRDSTALLHATAQAARALGGVEVVALHVHHGLMPEADAWLEHARALCARWARRGLPLRFASARLDGRPARGESVEAWARTARYAALATLARGAGASLVLLAHHRRDQAETFLLQALRGAGPAGLAAMPRRVERDGVVFERPWLERPRDAIEAYARRHRLRFVDDASNTDPRFARSRLRAQVWPALAEAFPDAESALATAARRAAQAAALLDAIADADLGDTLDGDALATPAWRALPAERRANALRGWLRRHGAASATLIERLARELPDAREAGWPLDARRELRLHRGRLRIVSVAAPAHDPGALSLTIRGPGRHPLPAWGGALVVRRVPEHGIDAATLASLSAAPRAGGERFQFAPRSTPRALKKQFQSRGVAAWQRAAPLFWGGDRLVFVPGLGLDARVLAAPGEPQFALEWEPDAPR